MRQENLDLAELKTAKCLRRLRAKIPFRFLVARIKKKFVVKFDIVGAGELRRLRLLANGPSRSAEEA
jgi:hypothetical protein